MNNRTALAYDTTVEKEPGLISEHEMVQTMEYHKPRRQSKLYNESMREHGLAVDNGMFERH